MQLESVALSDTLTPMPLPVMVQLDTVAVSYSTKTPSLFPLMVQFVTMAVPDST